MKFKEAFKLMEEGKRAKIDNTLYRVEDGILQYFQPDLQRWIKEFVNDTFCEYISSDEWYIYREPKKLMMTTFVNGIQRQECYAKDEDELKRILRRKHTIPNLNVIDTFEVNIKWVKC